MEQRRACGRATAAPSVRQRAQPPEPHSHAASTGKSRP